MNLLTVPEVAGMLRVSRMTVYRMVWSGDLEAIPITPNTLRIPEEAVTQLLAGRVQPQTRHQQHAAQ